MFGRLFGLFRGRSIVIAGVDKLADGHARKIDVGDPLAGGTQVVLCRVAGELFALDALCPHEGGRISDGPLVQGKYAICPLHNYTFDPRSGKVVRGVCGDAKRYAVKETDGKAELRV